eukprot:SAG11_NODE_29698_length_308_cov_0.746411_1_plen_87_part_10
MRARMWRRLSGCVQLTMQRESLAIQRPLRVQRRSVMAVHLQCPHCELRPSASKLHHDRHDRGVVRQPLERGRVREAVGEPSVISGIL